MRHLVAAPGCVYSPGEMVIADGRVVRVGPYRGRVKAIAIVPGLVNAHAHLQLPRLGKAVRSFLPWVRAVMAQRGHMSGAQLQAVAQAGLQSLSADGCTAVGEIDSTGLSSAVLRSTGMAGRCYRELTGFHLSAPAASRLLRKLDVQATRRAPQAWSPHAPYSVSPALFRAAFRSGRPLAIHVGEIPEEVEFLATGRGPFRDLLEGLGRLPEGFQAPGLGPVEWLDKLAVLGPRTSLVHCQEVTRSEIRRVAELGSSIVVCPGTVRYFKRAQPDVPGWLRLGIPVGLGTDSLASNRAFSMLQEMALARRLWPALSAAQVLQMATTSGARALCRPGLGKLYPGRCADFTSVEAEAGESTGEWMDAFTRGERNVLDTRLRGRSVEHKAHRS